jgi:hypothetical protein
VRNVEENGASNGVRNVGNGQLPLHLPRTTRVPRTALPGYDPCLPPASDYDCAGRTGDGPEYATGPIQVTGSDPYDLDSDSDGVACEA